MGKKETQYIPKKLTVKWEEEHETVLKLNLQRDTYCEKKI